MKEPEFKSKLGKRLRQLRSQSGLTQEALAELAGVHPRYISRVERGLSGPSAYVLFGLAKALDVSTAALVGETTPAFAVRIAQLAAPLTRKQREKLERAVAEIIDMTAKRSSR